MTEVERLAFYIEQGFGLGLGMVLAVGVIGGLFVAFLAVLDAASAVMDWVQSRIRKAE